MLRTAPWFGIAVVVCLGPALAPAHEFFSTKITWGREISRIVFKRCASCHREGASAFSLMTFEDVRPWATAIKEEVLSRRMPPWGAAKGFGAFEHDQGLSQDEISVISNWVEGGAPEGEKIYLPQLPRPALRAAPLAFRELSMPRAPLPASLRADGITTGSPAPVGARVTVELPDGSVEPLIWIIDPAASAKRRFVFREPRSFPAGSRFVVSKPGGSWKILVAEPASSRAAGAVR